MKLLQVHTFYQPYLNYFYNSFPDIINKSYREQNEKLIYDGFSASHMIAPHLSPVGYDSSLVIANALPAQLKWMEENGLKLQNRENALYEIVFRQIEVLKPDIIYFTDPINFDSRFINILPYKPKLILGWRAASIPEHSDFSQFDIILSNHRESLQEATKRGAKSTERFSPGMPSFISDAVKDTPKEFDIVFTGQVSDEHKKRKALLETIVKFVGINPGLKLGLFIPEMDKPVPEIFRPYNLGARWGMEMYRSLASGKIVFNAHIDLVSNEAANMRLFEATAAGSLLLTERYDNLSKFFEPDKEVAVYGNETEMIEKFGYYLENEDKLYETANAGQKRCLTEHSMEKRTVVFDSIIKNYLSPGKPVTKKEPAGYTLQGTIKEVLGALSGNIEKYQRRVPGKILIDGKEVRYADLHSYYFQMFHIFAQNLYMFNSEIPDPRIFDCGAHIGIASLYFSTKYPRARITAFEADKDISEMAEHNLKAYGVKNAEVINAAVWKNNDGVSFDLSGDDSGFINETGEKSVKVPSIRLREYIVKEKPDMLKIDIEGAEYEVLKDCRGVLSGVSFIITEVHRFNTDKEKLGELLSLFEDEGFLYTIADFNAAVWLDPDIIPPFPGVPNDKFLFTIYAWKKEKKGNNNQSGNENIGNNFIKTTGLTMLNLGDSPEHHSWQKIEKLPDNDYKLPYKTDSVDFVYQSGLLENLPEDSVSGFIKECYRVLKPGGTIRVVVPDTETVVKEYLNNLQLSKEGFKEYEDKYNLSLSKLQKFSDDNNKLFFDSFSLGKVLKDTGFYNPVHANPALSAIPDWERYNFDIDNSGNILKPDSIYMEAVK